MSEIERLRDRVEQLEEAFGINLQLPNEFGFTPLEMKILGILVARSIVSKDTIFDVVYGSLPENSQPGIKIVEVHIVKIRRKLLGKGWSIRNRSGVGYYLDPDARAALRNLCGLKPAFSPAAQGSPA
jgi:DNA-binding response OmpR family regulator